MTVTLDTNLLLIGVLGTTAIYLLVLIPYEVWWAKSRSNPLIRKPKRTFELLLTLAYIIVLVLISAIFFLTQ